METEFPYGECFQDENNRVSYHVHSTKPISREDAIQCANQFYNYRRKAFGEKEALAHLREVILVVEDDKVSFFDRDIKKPIQHAPTSRELRIELGLQRNRQKLDSEIIGKLRRDLEHQRRTLAHRRGSALDR